MIRASYIKKNSHTQTKARVYKNVVDEICRRTGINRDEWLLRFFEVGCEVAERTFQGEELKHVLMDESYKFWQEFMIAYIRHDRYVLESSNLLDVAIYARRKEGMKEGLILLMNEKKPA